MASISDSVLRRGSIEQQLQHARIRIAPLKICTCLTLAAITGTLHSFALEETNHLADWPIPTQMTRQPIARFPDLFLHG